MRRLIKKIVPCFQKFMPAALNGFRQPRFECHQRPRSADLEVYVPGVESDAVEIVVDNRDLVVTARKHAAVRTNFQSAHFEAVQHDYQLRLHLDDIVDTRSIWAALSDGILTIHLRKTAQAQLQLSVA